MKKTKKNFLRKSVYVPVRLTEQQYSYLQSICPQNVSYAIRQVLNYGLNNGVNLE